MFAIWSLLILNFSNQLVLWKYTCDPTLDIKNYIYTENYLLFFNEWMKFISRKFHSPTGRVLKQITSSEI